MKNILIIILLLSLNKGYSQIANPVQDYYGFSIFFGGSSSNTTFYRSSVQNAYNVPIPCNSTGSAPVAINNSSSTKFEKASFYKDNIITKKVATTSNYYNFQMLSMNLMATLPLSTTSTSWQLGTFDREWLVSLDGTKLKTNGGNLLMHSSTIPSNPYTWSPSADKATITSAYNNFISNWTHNISAATSSIFPSPYNNAANNGIIHNISLKRDQEYSMPVKIYDIDILGCNNGGYSQSFVHKLVKTSTFVVTDPKNWTTFSCNDYDGNPYGTHSNQTVKSTREFYFRSQSSGTFNPLTLLNNLPNSSIIDSIVKVEVYHSTLNNGTHTGGWVHMGGGANYKSGIAYSSLPTNKYLIIRFFYKLADDPATTSGTKEGFLDVLGLIGNATCGTGTGTSYGCNPNNPLNACKGGADIGLGWFISNGAAQNYIVVPYPQLINGQWNNTGSYLTGAYGSLFTASTAPVGTHTITTRINYDNGYEDFPVYIKITDTVLTHNQTYFKYGDGTITGSVANQLNMCQSDPIHNNTTLENIFWEQSARTYYGTTGNNSEFSWVIRQGSTSGSIVANGAGSSKTNYFDFAGLATGDYYVQMSNGWPAQHPTNRTLCQVAFYTFKVSVRPNPKPSLGIDKSFCKGDGDYTIPYTPLGGSFTTNITTGLSGGIFSPSSATTPLGQSMVYYQITTTTAGLSCINKDTVVFDVLSNPKPSIGSDFTKCSNEAPVTINPTISGGTFNSIPGLSSNIFTPSLSNIGSHGIVYTVTHANNCVNKDTLIATVNSNPKPNLGSDQSFCQFTAANYTIPNTPVGGTFKTLAGGIVSGLTGSSYNPTVAGLGSNTVVYEVNNGSSCLNSDTAVYTVYANPKPSLGSDQIYCSNAAPYTIPNSPTGGTFNTVSGLSGNVFTPSMSNVGTNNIFYSVNNGNGCTNGDTLVITVNSNPKPNLGSDQSFCQFTAANYTIPNTPVGGTFKTLAGGTVPGLTGSTYNPTIAGVGNNTVVYEVNNGSSCLNSDTAVYTVLANPKPSLGGSQSFCSASPAYTIPNTPVGGTFNTVTGLTGNVFTPSVAGVGSKMITYQVTNGTCSNGDTITMTVFSSPPAIVVAQDTIRTCNNYGNLDLVANTISPAGVNWSGSGISSNIFNPTAVAANNLYMAIGTLSLGSCSRSDTVFIDNKLGINLTNFVGLSLCSTEPNYNLGSLVVVNDKGGKHFSPLFPSRISNDSMLITASSVGSNQIKYYKIAANGCSDTVSYTMTVHANPKPSVGIDQVYCSNAASYTIPNSPTGGTFNAVTGLTGNVFTPSMANLGTNNIFYSVNNGNGCTNGDTLVITVNSNPKPSLGADQVYCSNAASYTIPNSPTGGTFNAVTGLTGNVFTPSMANVGTNNIFYSVNNGNGCTNGDTLVITVNSNPAAPSFIRNLDSVCTIQGSLPSNITLKNYFGITVGSGITESWTGTGQSGGVVNIHALNPGQTYSLNLIQTDGNNCRDTSIFQIKSNNGSNNVLMFSKTYDTICHSTGVVDLSTYNTNVQGGIWSYSAMPSAIQNDKDLSSTFLPMNTIVTMTYTADTNGCPVTKGLNVMRFKPSVNAGTDKNLCSNGSPEILQGSPAGGQWSLDTIGRNVFVFNPTTLSITQSNAAKEYNLYYTVSQSSCESIDTAVYTIIKKPNATYVLNSDSVCMSLGSINLTSHYGINPINGIWLGSNLNNQVLNLHAAGPGVKTHSYIIQNSFGCMDTTVYTTRIDNVDKTNIIDSTDHKVCEASSPINLNTFNIGNYKGIWSGLTVIDTVFYPSTTGVGTFNVLFQTKKQSCNIGITKKMVVVAKPAIPEITGSLKYCLGQNYTLLVKDPNPILTYQWKIGSITSSGTSKTGLAIDGTEIELTAVNDINCPSFSKKVKIELDEPQATIEADKTSILNNEEVSFNLSNLVNTTSSEWNFNDGSDKFNQTSIKHIFYNPSLMGDKTYLVECTIRSATGCFKTLSKTITVTKRTSDIADANKGEIRIYPNPATDFIHIEAEHLNSDEFTIFDANGRLILKDQLVRGKATVDLKNIAHGLYMLILNDKTNKIEIKP